MNLIEIYTKTSPLKDLFTDLLSVHHSLLKRTETIHTDHNTRFKKDTYGLFFSLIIKKGSSTDLGLSLLREQKALRFLFREKTYEMNILGFENNAGNTNYNMDPTVEVVTMQVEQLVISSKEVNEGQ